MPKTDPPDFTGQMFNHYQATQLLRQRPVSSLYLGEDTRQQQPVFLEILHTTLSTDAELAGRFQRRLETVAQLKHPHIAPILHTGSDAQQRPFAIIKHFPGLFLSEKLRSGEIAPCTNASNALNIVRSIASALALAHPAGIFHHDLRPENILLLDNNTPMLIDLGVVITPTPLAYNLEQERKLDYASPEQLRGLALTGRSNIFSLGILLYKALAGHRPRLPLSEWDIFDRRVLPKEIPLEQTNPNLTPETYQLVKNCLWQQDWNRFDTVPEMIEALDRALAAETAVLHHPPKKAKFVPNRRLILIGVALLLLIVVGIVGFLLLR